MYRYIDMNRVYGTNEDMRRYVDRYMAKERVDLQTGIIGDAGHAAFRDPAYGASRI